MKLQETIQPKLSIIIPIHNSEAYLEECLLNVINQSLENIEIICINNSSIDHSLAILQDFHEKDKRIHITNIANNSLAETLNIGMEKATGEYITFLFTGDIADLNLYETLYKQAVDFGSEVTICNVKTLDGQTGFSDTHSEEFSLDSFNEKFNNRKFSHTEILDFIFSVCNVSWNKIYKKAWLDANQIVFLNNTFMDNLFCLECLLCSDFISINRENFITHRINFDKNEFTDKKALEMFKTLHLEKDLLKYKGCYNDIKKYFKKSKKNTLLQNYKKISDKKTKTLYKLNLILRYPDLIFKL